MSDAFFKQFAGDGRARVKGQVDLGAIAACSDRPAEAAVIGALLRDASLVDQALDRLRVEDFYDHVLGTVFVAIAAMHADQLIAAPITVARRLAGYADLTERGGGAYLVQLAEADTIDRGLGYLDHLVDLTRRREVLAGLAELRGDLGDTALPLETTIGDVERVLSGALLGTTSRVAMSMLEAWDTTIAKLEVIGTSGVPRGTEIVGLAEWNEITGGMELGQFILLGARPAMGKTLLALKVACGAAEAGHGVLFISREMPVEQLMTRIIADTLFAEGSPATAKDVKQGKLSRDDYARAAAIRERIADWPLRFEEPPRLNAAQVGAIVRRHQREFASRGQTLKVVIIDYLGLLEPPAKRSNREQEMSDISRELKTVARSTGTTVIALAQLNRGVEQREDKRPLLSDLRDSGSLEQDADTVLFAYRAQYYLEMVEPDVHDEKRRAAWEIEMQAERDRLDIWSAKVRQDSTQRRKVYFFGSRQAIRGADYYRTGGGSQGFPR